MKLIKKYQKTIKDLLYSFFAYALPVLALQFAVQPFIASVADAEENGLFLTLYSVVKLCVSVLIAPLANVRLLHKKDCNEHREYDRGFNALFLLVAGTAMAISAVFCLLYRGANGDVWDCVRLLAMLLLVCAHDFYAIAFRLSINYKMILLDNFLIISGFALGLLLFRQFGQWELVFICGYVLGLSFVLATTRNWRAGVCFRDVRRCLPQYSQLCTSAGLNNATVYCDKLLIYPMLGGYSVSVYNAAAVVSKIISIVSVPVRNVLLSYIVDKDRFTLPKKGMRKLLTVTGVGIVVAYAGFYLTSLVFCRLLYPQFYQVSRAFIPFILLAILMETCSGVLNVVLLRFAPAGVQILVSGTKIGVYLAGVLLLSGACKMGLFGFCLAILLAATAQLALVVAFFVRIILKGKQDPTNESDTVSQSVHNDR